MLHDLQQWEQVTRTIGHRRSRQTMNGGFPGGGVHQTSTILASLTGVIFEIVGFIKNQTSPWQFL